LSSDTERETERDRLAILSLIRDRVLPQLETLSGNGSGRITEDLQTAVMGALVALCSEGNSVGVSGTDGDDIKEESAAAGAWALLQDLWKDETSGWGTALSATLLDTVSASPSIFRRPEYADTIGYAVQIAREELAAVESVLLHFVGRDAVSTVAAKTTVPALYEVLEGYLSGGKCVYADLIAVPVT
jgi:hypothetical protein